MRTVKFRAWSKEHKKMYSTDNYSFSFTSRSFGVWGSDDNAIDGSSYADKSRCAILMQYTGLKDKNGKGEELYESDLITNPSRNNGKPHPIIWSERYGGWCGDYGIHYLIAPELNEILRAGNVYENPELLQDSK